MSPAPHTWLVLSRAGDTCQLFVVALPGCNDNSGY